MAQPLSTLGARMVATAAATATAMASGTTTAEATALGNLLINLGRFPDQAHPSLIRTNDTNLIAG